MSRVVGDRDMFRHLCPLSPAELEVDAGGPRQETIDNFRAGLFCSSCLSGEKRLRDGDITDSA